MLPVKSSGEVVVDAILAVSNHIVLCRALRWRLTRETEDRSILQHESPDNMSRWVGMNLEANCNEKINCLHHRPPPHAVLSLTCRVTDVLTHSPTEPTLVAEYCVVPDHVVGYETTVSAGKVKV